MVVSTEERRNVSLEALVEQPKSARSTRQGVISVVVETNILLGITKEHIVALIVHNAVGDENLGEFIEGKGLLVEVVVQHEDETARKRVRFLRDKFVH